MRLGGWSNRKSGRVSEFRSFGEEKPKTYSVQSEHSNSVRAAPRREVKCVPRDWKRGGVPPLSFLGGREERKLVGRIDCAEMGTALLCPYEKA
jgi:hypothetical protein